MVLGPSPWSFSRSRIEAPYFFSSSWCRVSLPVVHISRMFVAMLLPMPGIASSAFSSSQMAATCSWRPSSASAARRYERMRNESSPWTSISSAVSLKTLAMDLLSVCTKEFYLSAWPRNILFGREKAFHRKGREGRKGKSGERKLIEELLHEEPRADFRRSLFLFLPLFLCAFRVLCGENLF